MTDQAHGQSATSADPADVEALKWVRGELFSLCEATEEAYAQSAADREGKPGAFARGRVHEAKGIRRAMGEVIAERLRTTRPSLPAPGREVKPLDWQETFTDRGDGSKDQTGWEADSGFGAWYAINQYFGSDSYGWEVQFDFDVIADCDDPDKAKAAAQADYEKRISAALSRPPENVDHRATEPAALRSAGDSDTEGKAKAALAYLLDKIVYRDSYGVPRSEFTSCHLCTGGGAPGIKFEHDPECPVLRCEEMGAEWWDEKQEEIDALNSEIEELKGSRSPVVSFKQGISGKFTPGDAVEVRGAPEIDEIVIRACDVHIEQMSSDGWFMGINTADGEYWQFWFGAKNRKAAVVFRHVEHVPAGGNACRIPAVSVSDTEGRR